MKLTFSPYSLDDQEICLALFDTNCPEYFAPSERSDYENFLSFNPSGYELCSVNGDLMRHLSRPSLFKFRPNREPHQV